jgi:hypothetical protein
MAISRKANLVSEGWGRDVSAVLEAIYQRSLLGQFDSECRQAMNSGPSVDPSSVPISTFQARDGLPVFARTARTEKTLSKFKVK